MRTVELKFIHGFMGHPSDWDVVRKGISDFTLPCDNSALFIRPAANWAESVSRLDDSLPENTVLVGYSMGARLSLGIAIEFPQKVKGLVFIAGDPGIESEEARTERWQSDQQVAVQIANAATQDQRKAFLEHWYQQSVFARLRPEIRTAEIARKLERFDPDWAEILRANSVANQPNFWPQIPKLQAPIMAVAGDRDDKYRRIATRVAENANVEGSGSTIIHDCGHMVHREQPSELIECIRQFVVALHSKDAGSSTG